MARRDWMTDVDRLADAVNGLQKCFDCTICLELMTMPMKTRCGHSFCKRCIERILSKKNVHCPLCNKSLKRRSISKDDHLEACIQTFMRLVTAIQIDSHIDILLHSKLPRDTRESCPSLCSRQPDNSNRRELSKKQYVHQLNQDASKTARSSTANRRTIIEHNNPRYDSAISSREPVIISSDLSDVRLFSVDENDDAFHVEFKPRTWIHTFADEPSTSAIRMEYEIPLDQNRIVPDNPIFDDYNNKSWTCAKVCDDTRRNKTEKSDETTDKTKEQDTAASGLKYIASHARIRANTMKKCKESAGTGKSDVKKTKNQNSSSSVTTHDQTSLIDASPHDHSALHSASTSLYNNKQSSANMNWSRVIEFGKEMRTRKKVKKLDVSTEKNERNPPRIVEDVMLTPSSKYDPSKSTEKHDTSDRETINTSNLTLESKKREQDVDKSPTLSTIDITSLSDRKADDWKESSIMDEANNSSSQVNRDTASYITLGEGKKIHIKNLDNRRVNDIIGFGDVNTDSQSLDRANVLDDSHRLEDNLKTMTKSHSTSPSHLRRLSVLTPEKLNETAWERNAISDNERTPVKDFASSSRVLAENRTPTPRMNNNSAQNTSGGTQLQFSTPNKIRLSLKRNQSAKRDDSPLLSELSLADRLSANKDTRESANNGKSVDSPVSKNALSLNRLAAVRRDLNLQVIGEDRPMQTDCSATASGVSSKRVVPVITITDNEESLYGIARQDNRSVVGTAALKKSTSIENQTRSREKGCSVKFLQLGTLIRRRDVKYFYMSTTKRERSMLAEVQVMPVYNMQQSISGSGIERTVANDDAISPNPSNNSQDPTKVTENIRLIDNSAANSAAISANMELSMAFPTCNIPASSTPKKDTDPCLDRQKTPMNACSSMNTSQSLNRSVQDTEENTRSHHKISCADRSVNEKITFSVHPEKKNLFKLLSPDKDSQLKFLSIDSPVTQRKTFKPTNSIQQQCELVKSTTDENDVSEAKDSRSAMSVGKMRKATPRSSESSEFVPQFPLGRKRKKRNNDKELFVDRSPDDSSDSTASDNSRCTIKLDSYKNYKKMLSKSSNASALYTNKKRRLEPLHAEEIIVKSEGRDTHCRKFKRIMFSSSDTETESSERVAKNRKRSRTRNEPDECAWNTNTSKKKNPGGQESDENRRIRDIVDKWTNEHNTSQKKLVKENRSTQDSNRSIKCSSKKDMTIQRSPSSINTPKGEKCRNLSSSQKRSPVIEPDLFDSNSMFSSNLEYTVAHQSTKANRGKPSQNSADPFNDDIINKVLQINRSHNNADASGSIVPTTQNSRTSQRGKDNNEYSLLQDNFDEIIANAELPQSEDMISCTEQSDRNHNRTLTVQNTSDYNNPAVTNESRGVTHPTTSTNDVFENCYSVRSVKKSRIDIPTNIISENSDKENIAFHGQEKHVEDRKDKKNVTVKNLAGAIDKSSRRTITSKNDTSHERERSLDRPVDSNEKHRTEARINVPTISTDGLYADDGEIQAETAAGNEPDLKNTSSRHDSCMNITQQQAQLEMFEEDLFGLAVRNRVQTTKIIAQDVSPREEQRTPRKKQSARNRDTVLEEHSAEEDDVVENTPETKMRNAGGNPKTIDSNTKKNIATPCLSPISFSKVPSNSPSSSKKSPPRTDARTPMSGVKMYPLYQSTPKLMASSTSTKCLNVSTMDEKFKRMASDGISQSRQIERKARENVQWQLQQQQQRSYKRTLCFVCSGLTAAQIGSVKELAQKYQANYMNKFDASVTHVIVNTTGEQNLAKSTLKYLQGIAHRKWIVSCKWIEDCIKQQKLLDEIPYEATTCNCGVNGAGPRNSRLRDKSLFEGYTFLCVGPYDNVSLDQYQDLLLATGATVVDTLEALAAEKKNLKGILIQDNMHDEKIEYWYRFARAAPIIIDWIVECIGQYKLISLFPFIQSLSTQDLYAIDYPRELVEEEEYSDTSI